MAVRKRTWKNTDGSETTRWFVDLYDANGERERKQFNTRREAEAARLETEKQIKSGTFRAEASKVTVKDAADRFLLHCDGRRTRGERMTTQNYKTMEGHIRNYICPDPKRHEGKHKPTRLTATFDGGIGGIRLAQLTARGVGDFRDRLRDAGVSVVTTRKMLSTLQQLLQHAVSRDLVGVNVARGVKVIGRRDEGARKIVPPTKETRKPCAPCSALPMKIFG